MKKGLMIAAVLALCAGIIAPLCYAGEGPAETAYNAGKYYVDKTCQGVTWFAENWWNCIVWVYGATENTLETRKLNGPKKK